MLFLHYCMTTALYLGQQCPPNMEAYLDSLSNERKDEQGFDLIVGDLCDIPDWITQSSRFNIREYSMKRCHGISIINQCRNVVAKYVSQNHPKEIRQITQPRWHAPGVLLATMGKSIVVSTRVSESNFREYTKNKGISKMNGYIVNNLLGQSVFLGDKVYTPEYGSVELPRWSNAERIIEPRSISTRFNPNAEPRKDLFEQDNRRVLVVGRVSYKKGIDLVLAAASRLPDWEFVIIGNKRDTNLVKESEKLSNVLIYGPVDYINMPGAYTACDVLLSTSRVEWGGISRAMLEARQTDQPVIALDNEDASSVASITINENVDSVVNALRQIQTE